jgi:hypothetical protein
MTTNVLDCADWLLAQPAQATGALDLSGTPFTLALTSIFGGLPVATASSENETLVFVPAVGSLPAYFAIDMRVADRTWRTPRAVTVRGDTLRQPEPDRTEWVGRITFVVEPGSGSTGIATAAMAPVLSAV